MARRGHPSDPIFKKHNVSKDQLSLDDLLPAVRAIQEVGDHSVHIGRTLGLPPKRLAEIGTKHQHSQDRRAIAIVDTWLRGNFNQKVGPYPLHSEKYRCPSWWNLVWAVAHSTGGDNPAHALKIALSPEEWYKSADSKHDFSDVDSTPLTQYDVDSVNVDLMGVWSRWYEIGVALHEDGYF